MPWEEATITFYRLDRFGYYYYGDDAPQFGAIGDVLEQLRDWVAPGVRSLVNTCTYELEEGDENYRTFCYDIVNHRGAGDYLLTTWNEMPTVDGEVASVDGNGTVGNAQVDLTAIPDGHIPGYSTYFWFIPEHSVFATIRFQHRNVGLDSMLLYMKEFLAKFTDHVVSRDDGEGGLEILGYTYGGADFPNVYPRVQSRIYKKPGQIDGILSNHARISKLVRKNSLDPEVHEHTSMWQNFLRMLVPDSDPNPMEGNLNIKFEIPFRFSFEELRQMVDNWLEDHASSFDDIGFRFVGENKVHWLSYSIARSPINLNVERVNQEVVSASSLLDALVATRRDLLRLIL